MYKDTIWDILNFDIIDRIINNIDYKYISNFLRSTNSPNNIYEYYFESIFGGKYHSQEDLKMKFSKYLDIISDEYANVFDELVVKRGCISIYNKYRDNINEHIKNYDKFIRQCIEYDNLEIVMHYICDNINDKWSKKNLEEYIQHFIKKERYDIITYLLSNDNFLSYIYKSKSLSQLFYDKTQPMLYIEMIFNIGLKIYEDKEMFIIQIFERIMSSNNIEIFKDMFKKYSNIIYSNTFKILALISIPHIKRTDKIFFETFIEYCDNFDIKHLDNRYDILYNSMYDTVINNDMIISLFITVLPDYFCAFMKKYKNMYNYKNLNVWKELLESKTKIQGPKLCVILDLVPEVFTQISVEAWQRILYSIEVFGSSLSDLFEERILRQVLTEEYIKNNLEFFKLVMKDLPQARIISISKISSKIKSVIDESIQNEIIDRMADLFINIYNLVKNNQ